MRHTRTLAATVTAALAVAGLAACGGSKQASASGSASQASAPMVSVADAMNLATQKTGAYSSVKIKAVMGIPGKGSMNMSGSFGWKPFAMDVTMTSSALAAETGGQSMTMMYSGTAIYMNMGAKFAGETGGKHWMKMDLSSLGKDGQGMSDALNQTGGQDPSTQLKLLTSAKGIKRVGTETVDGVQATHYQGTVKVADIAAGQSESLKKLLANADKEGITTETIDAWVNADNLPVRVVTSAPSSQGVFTSTVDYSDYSSSPVTITPPPASDTFDFAGMLKGKA